MFTKKENALLAYLCGETVRIEAWGENALRVRATKLSDFSGKQQALNACGEFSATIHILEDMATVENGKIKCVVDHNGCITFYKDGRQILKEYYRIASAPKDKSSVLTTTCYRQYGF